MLGWVFGQGQGPDPATAGSRVSDQPVDGQRPVSAHSAPCPTAHTAVVAATARTAAATISHGNTASLVATLDGRSGRAVPVVVLTRRPPSVGWCRGSRSPARRRSAAARTAPRAGPPTLSRKCPTPGGVARRAANEGGDDQLVTRRASASVRSTTRRTASSSACGRPPSSSIPARSTNPAALARSAGSGSAARSARLWVIITCPTPWARFRRVSASRRSTMPDPARIARHSSSRTIRNRRCGARPASVSALAASTAPNPSAHTASRAAAWVEASSGTADTSTASAGLVRSRRVVVGPSNMAPRGESSR